MTGFSQSAQIQAKVARCTALIALAFLAAPAPAAARPVVVTSNMILADFVRQVGGDSVQVVCMARPGASLHDFEPRATDVRDLARADVVVVNGLGLEPWIGKLVANSGFKGAVVEASRGVVPIETAGAHGETAGATHPHEHEADPHAWLDPAAARIYVGNIREALDAALPGEAARFAAREQAFLDALDRIDAWARAGFAALPPGGRRVVTSHASLGYLGRAYGIEIISVRGVSALAEPSARRIAGIIDLVRASGAKALFFDVTDNPAIIRQIAADTGVPVSGGLFTDSLDEPGTGTDTYLKMMEQNLRRILDSLGEPAHP